MPAVTAAARSSVKVGAGTLVSHAAVTTPALGYSLHDCADAGSAGLHNCIWPVNLASADGKAFKFGLVVFTRVPGGSVSVTHA